MNKTEKRRQLMVTLNLGMTALILLGVIVIAGWLLMLDQQVNQLSSAVGDMATQLTLQPQLDAYQEEIDAENEAEEQETSAEEPAPTDTTPASEAAPTEIPTETPSELTETFYQQIQLVPSGILNELSDQRYFRLPPLIIELPDGWNYRYESEGKLTLSDSFGNEVEMIIRAVNGQGEFVLNQIGYFQSLANGGLSWYPDSTPHQGLVAGEYTITANIGGFVSSPLSISIEDAPMARILESISLYRTAQDIEEDRRYLSFDSQQEPMSMFGYMVSDEGILYIRVWRAHDKFYYWVKGEHVMHPEMAKLYNDLEDLQGESGEYIIPEIVLPDN